MPKVADYVLERLTEWGIHRIYGYPGDGINGFLGALDRADGQPGADPDAARGDGRVHGGRPREVHRRDRLLHGHLRWGRHPPAQRPLRREARPPAGGGDRRAAEAVLPRRGLPAGDRPDPAVQRRLGVRADLHAPGTGASAGRPGLQGRVVQPDRRDDHLPGRRAGGRRAAVAAAHPRRRLHQRRLGQTAGRPPGDGAAQGRGDPQRGQQGRDAGRAGRGGGAGRGHAGRRAARRWGGEDPPRAGSAARRPALRHGPDRAARLDRQLRADDGRRHPVHGRHQLPLLGVAARRGPVQGRRDRPRRPDDRRALPRPGQSHRRLQGHAAGVAPAAEAQG